MVAVPPIGCAHWVRANAYRDKTKPFFLKLAALDPNRDYTKGSLAPPHRIDEVIVPVHLPDTRDVREDLRLYDDEIGRLDNYVGSVRAQLERVSLAENTVVLFFSCNGRPFPRDRKTISDGGFRTL
jgi:arylsulfatase A-like enzyme